MSTAFWNSDPQDSQDVNFSQLALASSHLSKWSTRQFDWADHEAGWSLPPGGWENKPEIGHHYGLSAALRIPVRRSDSR